MSGLAEATLRAAAERAARTSRLERRAGGVVPTPVEVAHAALRRVDALVRDDLGIADGLASSAVQVIDPAVGTGVWLAALLDLTRATGAASQLVGIDVDAAALDETAALLAPDAARQGARLSLHCANTLALARAPAVDDGDLVRVIVGNPPWSTRSRSRGQALSDAWLADFRRDVDGAPLGERRAGVLSDDYVRFFRWALEQATTAPRGAVVCLATNGSFLDGPVHRGMRAALLCAFDRIELLDLGGNALLSRGAARDDNVFGVRVGAALTWAVRRPGTSPRRANVAFGRVGGARAEKLAALAGGALPTTLHTPSAPWLSFRPALHAAAPPGFSLDEAFPFHREGVQTNRDAIAIDHTRAGLEARLHALADGTLALAAAPHLDPERARQAAARALDSDALPISELAYRPLDRRYFLALAPICHRPRPELLRALAHAPLSLVAVRKERGGAAFNLFAAGYGAVDACFLSSRSSCRTRVFPSHRPDGGDNLAPAIAARLARLAGTEVSARAVIAYALAVLGSPRFRAAHDAALKCDYARLPWPRDAALFAQAVAVGERFVAALWEPCTEPSPCALAPGAAPDMPLEARALCYDEYARCVTLAGMPLLLEVAPACWSAQVGHHSLVASALRGRAAASPPNLSDLVDVLARAAAWRAAEAGADALYDPR